MYRMPLTLLWAVILGSVLLWGNSNVASAQPNSSQKVKFETGDGIELHGNWYPATKKNAPVVMFVHKIGEDGNSAEWRDLAKTLQNKDYAVLQFDLRGHGGSTTITNPQAFSAYNKGLLNKNLANPVLDWKDYHQTAYAVFVNDLSAAKAFLDQKNDALECNSSALVVVAANDGALLASLWMKSEWYRYPLVQQNPLIPNSPLVPQTNEPEGKNIMAAIFLSMPKSLGSVKVEPKVLLHTPVGVKATPTVFMYNESVDSEKDTALACEKALKGKGKQFQFTGASAVQNAKNLTGADLLQKNLNTDKLIVDWLNDLTNANPANNWAAQNFTKTRFCWYLNKMPWIPANYNQQFIHKTMNYLNYGNSLSAVP